MESTELFLYFLKTLAFWCFYLMVVNLIMPKSDPLSVDTKNRIVSISHGLLGFVVPIYDILVNKSSFEDPSTEFQKKLIVWSLSYFIYDMIACWYYGLLDGSTIVHHAVCWLGEGTAVFYGWGATAALGGLIITEVSNFPMHLRKIL